jgi:ketosteroid isomerase-like protein
MPQENVEIVREYFEIVNDGDFARAMRYYADDVELVVPAEAFLEPGTFTGKDAVGLLPSGGSDTRTLNFGCDTSPLLPSRERGSADHLDSPR